ncbi:MAG: hypothetical protein ACLTQI_03900 [Slackia sp.]
MVAEILEAAFGPSYVTTVEGGRAANEELLDQKLTTSSRSPAVGKLAAPRKT